MLNSKKTQKKKLAIRKRDFMLITSQQYSFEDSASEDEKLKKLKKNDAIRVWERRKDECKSKKRH